MSNLPLQIPALIYLGANAHNELEHQLLTINPSIKFLESAIYPERHLSSDINKVLSESVVKFDSHLCGKDGEILFSPILNSNQIAIINSVMDDKLLPLLWTRFGGRQRWRYRSEVKRYEVIYSLAKSAIDLCQKLNPKIVVFSYEPHVLPIYIFKMVCQAMDINTYSMSISPFNWKVFLRRINRNGSIDTMTNVFPNVDSNNDSVARFIAEKTGDYSEAKPYYEKRTEGGGWLRRFSYRLSANNLKPQNIFLSQRALFEYRRLVTPRSFLQGKKYICMFLQFQPEQTTLPDGGLFADQLFAIQMLYAAATRLNLSLVIREHPATFESTFDRTWRPLNFYSTIKTIGPDIYLDDLDVDPYSLIKGAVAVSAITGTVLLEGLLLGRPAIAFGRHSMDKYSSISLVDNFSNDQDLVDKLEIALSYNSKSICEDIKEYLFRIYPSTFGANEYVGNTGMSLELLRKSRYEALSQVIKSLLI